MSRRRSSKPSTPRFYHQSEPKVGMVMAGFLVDFDDVEVLLHWPDRLVQWFQKYVE